MEPTVYPIVEKYLKEQGKKVEELADEIGTSRSTMYYKLNGGSEVSIGMASVVKKALGATEDIETLFQRDDNGGPAA